MSLILEALRKAERQHKLGEVPRIAADSRSDDASGMGGLGWVMLLLFACIMLAIGLYLGGFRLPFSQETPAEQLAEEESPAFPSTTPKAQPATSVQPLPSSVSGPAEVLPAPQPQPVAQPKPVPRPVAKPKPAPARPLSEMPSGFVANLPPLNIDIHSYDKQPEKRYVLINMERYREGDYLAEGPLLVEIRADGVVLEHMGERFILPIGN